MTLNTFNLSQFQFENDHLRFFPKFMEWYWKCRGIDDSQFIIEFNTMVTLSDFDFIYSLWKNGVSTYDEKMQERLNRLREVYMNNQK